MSESDGRLMTVREAAAELGISPSMVRAERDRGRLPFRIVGKRFVRFAAEDLATYRSRIAATKPGLQRSARSQKVHS